MTLARTTAPATAPVADATDAPPVGPQRTAPRPAPSAPLLHLVSIREGQFNQATCTCGWVTAGRRSRPLAREEAHDHVLLYSGTLAPRG